MVLRRGRLWRAAPRRAAAPLVPHAVVVGMGRERHKWQTLLRRHLGDGLAVPTPHGMSKSAPPAEFAHFSDRLVISVHPSRGEASLEWVDVTAHPATTLQHYRNALAALLLEQGIPDLLAQSTVERSVLLPQTATIDVCTAVIVRLAVDAFEVEMDSIQELTNRLTVFFTPQRVFTVHRVGFAFLSDLSRRWPTQPPMHTTPSHVLHLIVREASRSFRAALSRSLIAFDQLERRMFIPDSERPDLVRSVYHIKRRVAVYSRVLAITSGTYDEVALALSVSARDPLRHEAQQDLTHIRAIADDLGENANTVLQLLFQLSTYELNELIRILTVFSAFFIPLGFIAGVLGMNIPMPARVTEDPLAWWYCAALMLCVTAAIAGWFRWRGFC